ncbi:MAG: S49 family peptidase, partial [Steroidobacteraceae bacterium]
MIATPNFAARLFNTPAGLHAASHHLAIGMLADWTAATRGGKLNALAEFENASGGCGPAYQVVSGVAIIPVRGILIQRLGPWWWVAEMCGVAGYDVIRLLIMQALADPKIDALVLDIDSPGGEVAGCFDLVDTIYAGRAVKPIAAIL